MLKTTGYDVVFQEIPDEVSLAINLSNCPFRCPGCHSPYLQEDVGEELTPELFMQYVSKYKDAVTCVVFMGGDADTNILYEYAKFIKENFPNLKTGWYSGRLSIAGAEKLLDYLDYVKLSPYKQELGGLKSKKTNQRLYKVVGNKELEDITSRFWEFPSSI